MKKKKRGLSLLDLISYYESGPVIKERTPDVIRTPSHPHELVYNYADDDPHEGKKLTKKNKLEEIHKQALGLMDIPGGSPPGAQGYRPRSSYEQQDFEASFITGFGGPSVIDIDEDKPPSNIDRRERSKPINIPFKTESEDYFSFLETGRLKRRRVQKVGTNMNKEQYELVKLATALEKSGYAEQSKSIKNMVKIAEPAHPKQVGINRLRYAGQVLKSWTPKLKVLQSSGQGGTYVASADLGGNKAGRAMMAAMTAYTDPPNKSHSQALADMWAALGSTTVGGVNLREAAQKIIQPAQVATAEQPSSEPVKKAFDSFISAHERSATNTQSAVSSTPEKTKTYYRHDNFPAVGATIRMVRYNENQNSWQTSDWIGTGENQGKPRRDRKNIERFPDPSTSYLGDFTSFSESAPTGWSQNDKGWTYDKDAVASDDGTGTGGNDGTGGDDKGRSGPSWRDVQNRLNELGFTDDAGNRLATDNQLGRLTRQAWAKANKGSLPSSPGLALKALARRKDEGVAPGEEEAGPQAQEGLTAERKTQLKKYLVYDGPVATAKRQQLLPKAPLEAELAGRYVDNAETVERIDAAYDLDEEASAGALSMALIEVDLPAAGAAPGADEDAEALPLWNGQKLFKADDTAVTAVATSPEDWGGQIAMIDIEGNSVPHFMLPNVTLDGKDVGNNWAPLTLRDNIAGKGPNYLTGKEQGALVKATGVDLEGPDRRKARRRARQGARGQRRGVGGRVQFGR